MRKDTEELDTEEGDLSSSGGNPLASLSGLLARRWPIMAPVALAVLLGASFVAMSSPHIYAANAVVLINSDREQLVGAGKGIEEAGSEGSRVDSEMEVFRSQSLVRRLVDTLHLENDPEWGVSSSKTAQSGKLVDAADASQNPAVAEPAVLDAERDAVARNVAPAINVSRRGSSNAISITVESTVPAKAARVVNTLVDLYFAAEVDDRLGAVGRANSWFAERLDDLKAQVSSKELAAEAYRVANHLSPAAGGDDSTQMSGDVQTLLVTARADLAERQARLRQVREMTAQGRSADSIADVLNSSVITDLRSREAELTTKEAELSQRYVDAHPTLVSLRSELAIVRQRIQDEVSRVAANLQNEVEVSRARLSQLQGSFGSVAPTAGESGAPVIRYREMLRDAAAARAVYESFLERSHEIAQQGDAPNSTARVISKAIVPITPVRPNLRSTLLMALLFAGICGLAAGLALEFLDRSIHTADEVERKCGYPAVASVPFARASALRSVPANRRSPPDYLVERPQSAFAESLRVLRTAILHAHIDEKVKVVALTSALPDEGKSTVAMCLARTAATSGQKVALVDCDLRRPSVSAMAGGVIEAGLLEVLTSDRDWRAAMKRDGNSTVDILPVAPSQFSPRDVFSSNAMARLMQELRGAYDLVILDCPPILAVAETRVILRSADASVLVVRSGRTPLDAVRIAIRESRKTGVDLVGLVLNFVDHRKAGWVSQGDASYYGSRNKAYYQD